MTIKKRFFALVVVMAISISACSFMNNGQSAETIQTKENKEETGNDQDEIEAMKAEIEDLKAELAEKNEESEEVTEASEETEEEFRGDEEDNDKEDSKEKTEYNEKTGKNGDTDYDVIKSKYQASIDENPELSQMIGYYLVDLMDDDIPELLCVRIDGLFAIGMYDGHKLKLCALDYADCFGESVQDLYKYGDNLAFYYGEHSNRFALYNRLEGNQNFEERNKFFEIDSSGNINETNHTAKQGGKEKQSIYYTDYQNQGVEDSELFDATNKKGYEGLDKKISLKYDIYYSLDEAFDAYMNDK